MHSDNACHQPLINTTSSTLITSDKKETYEGLEPTKQQTFNADLVKEEGSLVSHSTENSEMQNQSNGTSSHHSDDESCQSPSSEKKKESLEESKAEQAETIQSAAWGKPLKKVPKQADNNMKPVPTTTAVLKVVKPPLPKRKSALQEFYDNWRGYDRNGPRNKSLYQGTLTILKSNPTSSKTQQNEREALLPQTDVYKDTLTQQEVTAKQHEELARKLSCSVSGTSIFDSPKPNLGYPVYLDKDIFKRLRPVPIMKLLTYQAFFDSPSRYEEDCWLPVYINEAHFKRNKQDIFNAIALISQQIEGKEENEEFHPLMILRVLPTLLVKTTIHLLKRNVTQNKESIDAFCQLYRLFVKLVELFPEIKETIDQQIKDFCSSGANRHQKVEEDLGEFLIKLSVSSEGLQNAQIINLVLQEHLARQASFGLKKEKDLGKGEHECDKFLESYLSLIHMSNQVLLGTIEICRLLLDNELKTELEVRCGVLNKGTRRVFLNRLSWIRRNVVKDWKSFIGALQQESYVSDEQVMASYVVKSFEAAKANGYLD